ncbi:protein of unknown function DUF324 [Candidatus Magnetoovum chiemensis]|nr:protein of unknown function DUF324 [Candidatus Magnetoovum chiemensis]
MTNNTANKPLYIAEGDLIVETTKSYWFTLGGEKGSFGYYSHLKNQKDNKQLPLFADTQVHGDIRMAAEWLADLETDDNNKKTKKELINKVFGERSKTNEDKKNSGAGLLYITDLELTKDSQSDWNNENFEVKPKIEINDETRTVKDKMLASFEYSYMNKFTLTAKLYLGYFDDENKLTEAMKLLDDAIPLLSGFGAFRSRGYGRGSVRIENWKCDKINYTSVNHTSENTSKNAGISIKYAIRCLTNFRNKQINPAGTQLLVSRKSISDKQLRAWFIKTYQKVFNDYPTIEQLSMIDFPPLYPSKVNGNNITLCFPPAVTTIKNEKGNVKDMAGREIEKDEENFFATKTKPLPEGSFVTDSDKFEIETVSSEKRVRNSMEETFITLKEGGLFVQELIKKDTWFAGTIKLKDTENNTDKEFIQRTMFILEKVKPIINKCIFEPLIDDKADAQQSGNNTSARIVISPIVYNNAYINYHDCKYKEVGTSEKDKKRIVREGANQIALTSLRLYNTTLNRQRRPRIVIATGSVIYDTEKDNTAIQNDALLAWKGFGKDLKEMTAASPENKETGKVTQKEDDTPPSKPKTASPHSLDEKTLKLLADNITKREIEELKLFSDKNTAIEEIKRKLATNIECSKAKGIFKGHRALYKKINELIDNNELDQMRLFIEDTIYKLSTIKSSKSTPPASPAVAQKEDDTPQDKTNADSTNSLDDETLKLLIENMTRAQVGILREFLNENRTIADIQKVVKDRVDKYENKDKFKGHLELYKKINELIDEKADSKELRQSLNRFINDTIDKLHRKWWEKREKDRKPQP